MDWPAWNGPLQNRISLETGLPDRFDPKGGDDSNVVFKSEIAAGISTPIVMHGRLFTIVRDQPGTPRDAEKIICLDAVTGELIWENIYNVFLSDLPAERVGWSNVCGDPETDRIYALGACCLFQCIDAKTGKTIWSRSLSEQFGMLSTYGGRTNTPVVFEDLVIISGVTTGWDETAKPAHRFLAFNKIDGRLVWLTSTRPLPEDTTYSTPVIRVINGQSVMVAGAGDGNIYGMQPRTGKILWKETISRRGINTSAAVGDDGRVYAAHGEENPVGTAMGAIVGIDAPYASLESVSAEKWRTEELTVGKSSPLLVGDRLYVVEDSSRMHVLNAETGAAIGEPLKLGTAMRGSLLFADGKIYAATSTGIFHVLQLTDDGVESLFKIRLPKGHDVGGSPIVSHGRIYLPTTGGLFCIANPDTTAALAKSDSPSLIETEATASDEIAQLQLIPAEAIIAPGSKTQLEVVAFNTQGRRLKTPPMNQIKFQVAGPGSIDASGVLQAQPGGTHEALALTATFGEARATSRIRLIPPLPWQFDFSPGEVPVTWIGARYRHEPRVVDDNPAIVKITTIPKGTRSQTWFGPTALHDYTITADVKAAGGTAKLPDMGVIAQRYTLDLMGESQQLQIRTWAAQLRMAKSTPVQWEANVWYTLKFEASVKDGVAELRGKVWPRDQSEPAEWTVTATDEAANLIGSPGLFGNATNAEVFIDNVNVKKN
jgi:outer membrane protein assembly factor BamB